MLRTLAPDQLWIADMPAKRLGFEFGARMTVVRLSDGGLFLHSPVALGAELRIELDALGAVRFVVSPARFHYLHVAEFAAAYPDARIHAAPGSRGRLKGIPLAGVLSDNPEPEWADVLDQALFRGSALYDEADFFHRPSRTLILTDLLFNIPTHRSGITRLIARALGILGRLATSASFRPSIRDRQAVRVSIERILAWDFDRVILSHGEIVETGGKVAVEKAFSWFMEAGS